MQGSSSRRRCWWRRTRIITGRAFSRSQDQEDDEMRININLDRGPHRSRGRGLKNGRAEYHLVSALRAIGTLAWLLDAKSPSVQLEAAREILNRAGLRRIKRVRPQKRAKIERARTCHILLTRDRTQKSVSRGTLGRTATPRGPRSVHPTRRPGSGGPSTPPSFGTARVARCREWSSTWSMAAPG